jgi:putative MATE family efflux protein
MFSYAGSCCIRACGSPAYAMGTQLVGALINVILDAWFVLGLQMGVKGAAVATVISQAFAMLWVLGYFFSPHARLRLRRVFIFSPHETTLRRILAVGTPPFLVQLNFVLIHGLMNVAVAKYGGDLAVSANGIFMSMDSLLFMPAVALGEGAQPIIGYNYGARRFDRVRQTVKWAIGATTVFYIFSFIVIFFHAEFFVRFFNNSNEALITLAARAMRVANLGIPVMGVSIVTSSTLQGLGHARAGLILSFVRFGLLLVVPLAIFPHIWGLYGTWGCFPLSDITGSLLSLFFLLNAMKKMRKES